MSVLCVIGTLFVFYGNFLKKEFNEHSFSCSYFPKCSGCKRQTDVRNPEVWIEICEFFTKVSSIQPELISKEITGWRSKAKLAVRGSFDHPKIGLFEEGSHNVIDLKRCPLHYPVMDEALDEIRREIKECKIDPYQEKGHLGRLRYLQMLVDRKTLKIQLTLVIKGTFLEENERAFVKQLYNEGRFHSIWINYLPEKTNSIFGNSWDLVEGEEDFFQEINGIFCAFHPSCFSQAHLSLFDDMISFVNSLVEEGKRVLELYAGVGCIGLSLAATAEKVILVESSLHAEKCFKKTLEKLSDRMKEKCYFLTSKVEDMDLNLQAVDVILVDPPRKGLSIECKKQIVQSDATQLIYISCGYESFMRDCKEFLAQNWELETAKGFLLFPGTNHVEIIANFKKLE